MAGTFIKLQEAYASENNAVGGWAAIGYKGPGNQHNASSTETGTFLYDDNSTTGAWKAYAKVALNDCNNGTWTVTTTYSSSGNVSTTVKSSSKNNCVTPLMPNFCKLATNGSCGTDG